MDIEPLKVIIDLSENKMNSVVFFLNDIIKKKINSYYLYEEKNKDIFINQYIICIKKNNLSLDLIYEKIIPLKEHDHQVTGFKDVKWDKYKRINQKDTQNYSSGKYDWLAMNVDENDAISFMEYHIHPSSRTHDEIS